MIVRYGPTDISDLEKELRKLGSFFLPSRREMAAMELLYEVFHRTGQNKPKKVLEIFQALNISAGQDIGTLNESRFLEKTMEGTHEAFKLSSDGVRYMDYLHRLELRRYEDLGGSLKNDEMENHDKCTRARQWAKEHMAEIVNGISHTPSTQQNISGAFFEVGGDMRNDGTILTDKNAVVGVNVRGNYTSKKGKMIQGEHIPEKMWHKTWWGVVIIGVAVTVIGGWILAMVL